MILTEFRKSHEMVRIEVVPMETPRQFEALSDGQIDVGIVRPRRLCPAGVLTKVVQTERLLAAMSASHPLARRGTVAARALADQSFIVPQFAEEEGFGSALSALGKAGGFTLTWNIASRISSRQFAWHPRDTEWPSCQSQCRTSPSLVSSTDRSPTLSSQCIWRWLTGVE
jgi:DNA-binding transcriptional LysR family regulator